MTIPRTSRRSSIASRRLFPGLPESGTGAEASIELVPVIAAMGDWGSRWLPTEPALAVRARLLAEGGPPMWARMMDELRDRHLDGEPAKADGVLGELTVAYQRAVDAR